MDIKIFQVNGSVTNNNGDVVTNAEVIVWWQQLRKRIRLTQGITDEQGQYHLKYERPKDATGKILIVVECLSKAFKEPLQSQPLASQPELKVDLVAKSQDRPEYAKLLNAIKPHLRGLKLFDLVENKVHQDISLLTQEIGYSAEEITQIVICARLEEAYKIPAEVFFAFLYQRIPASIPSPLLEASQNFSAVDALVQLIGPLIFKLSSDVQSSTLKIAIEKKIIDISYEKKVSRLVNQLQSEHVTDVLNKPYLRGKANLTELIDLAGVAKEKHGKFADALVNNQLSMDAFWKSLPKKRTGLTKKEISSLQQTFEIGAFVDNNLPLVKNIRQGFANKRYKSLSDLARLDTSQWSEMLQKSGAAKGAGAVTVKDRETLAKTIRTRFTRAYPTAALAAIAVQSKFIAPTNRKSVERFFANNPELELRTMNLTGFLIEKGKAAFSGIKAKEQPAVTLASRKLQRILRITLQVDHAIKLLEMGLHSATQIRSMGRQQFIAKAAEAGLPKDVAATIYLISEQRYAGLLYLFMQFNQGFINVMPKALGQSDFKLLDYKDNIIQHDPSLATLFGSQDYCADDGCTSILSPAAYLCDLLYWLGQRKVIGSNQTAVPASFMAQDAFFARRPDIKHLLLNCPNTEVPLPYIDLVNELLEDAVHSLVPSGEVVWKQTTWTAAELRAEPEYVNIAAYQQLRDEAVYPHTLPYDWALDALRTYLSVSGVPLWQLREELLPFHGDPPIALKIRVAAEWFGICDKEHSLIVSSDEEGHHLTKTWNTDDPVHELTQLVPRPNNSDDDGIAFFLQTAGISYSQLLELLAVKWVVGDPPGLKLQTVGSSDEVINACDLSEQKLGPELSPHYLDRIHRFLRMWRHDNWAMWELDLLIRAPIVGNGELNNTPLENLFEFRRLQNVTGLAVDAQLAFYQDIDTNFDSALGKMRDHVGPDEVMVSPLFSRLFLDPSVLRPSDDAYQVFSGLPAGNSSHVLGDYMDVIRSALTLPESAVKPLADSGPPALFVLMGLTLGNALSIRNLTKLYRGIELARAVRMSVPELNTLLPLTTFETMDAVLASPRVTQAFIKEVQRIEKSGFTGDDIVYLLRRDPDSPVAITDTVITDILKAIRQAMQGVEDELTVGDHIAALKTALAQLGVDPRDSTEILAIVKDDYNGSNDPLVGTSPWTASMAYMLGNLVVPTSANGHAYECTKAGTSSSSEPTWPTGSDSTVNDGTVTWTETSSAFNVIRDRVLERYALDAAHPLPNLSVSDGTTLTQDQIEQRAQDVLKAIKVSLNRTLVIQVLHLKIDLKAAVMVELLANVPLPSGSGAPPMLLDTLTDPEIVKKDSDGTYSVSLTENDLLHQFLHQYLAVRLLHKIGIVVQRLRLNADEVSWLLDHAPDYGRVNADGTSVEGGLDLKTLPVSSGASHMKLSELLSTVLLIKLKRSFTSAKPDDAYQDLFTVIAAIADGSIGAKPDVGSAMATITGWSATDIAALTSSSFTLIDYQDPKAIDRLRRLEGMLTATGATSGMQLRRWSDSTHYPMPPSEVEPVYDAAQEVRSALKSRYSVDDWCTMAPKFMDPIRERRSAALQAYLLGLRQTEFFPGPKGIPYNRLTRRLIYGDVDGLFAHFLIDVQMSACELTTRVVQAYAAVQLFVERCLMGLDNKMFTIVPDDGWKQWSWRSRYRKWEAARKVFLYPENWLIESQRPNRTDIFRKLEQQAQHNERTRDHLESIMLDYVDGLGQLAHLHVTGTYTDNSTNTTYVIAKAADEPSHFYLRSYSDNAWSTWEELPFQIQAEQVIPTFYSGSLYVFWMNIKVENEKHQNLPKSQDETGSPPQNRLKYVRIGFEYSMLRNGRWNPPLKSKGDLFDIPYLLSIPDQYIGKKHVKSIYTLKIRQVPDSGSAFGESLKIDVFRGGTSDSRILKRGKFYIDSASKNVNMALDSEFKDSFNNYLESIQTELVNIGRATFDGRINSLQLNNIQVIFDGELKELLKHVQDAKYGPYVNDLQVMRDPLPNLNYSSPGNFSGVVPKEGALIREKTVDGDSNNTLAVEDANTRDIIFNSHVEAFRIVCSDNSLYFDTDVTNPFFFQDGDRCYFVENPFGLLFRRFYHRYAQLFWHQLSIGGFDLLYNPKLQISPDSINSAADFSAKEWYGANQASVLIYDDPAVTELDETHKDRGVQFAPGAAYSTYNWELFYHAPLYIAEQLSRNQKFEDAQTWYRYIFDPTRRGDGTDLPPQSYWIPRPLHALTSPEILAQRIDELFQSVNSSDSTAVRQVNKWEKDPFNPFLLAFLRPTVYMKRAVMSYLDNLIAWADNLFQSDSREALNEATLLYVTASEILGRKPTAISPPQHADKSFDDLKAELDAFANAMVGIENYVSVDTPPAPEPSSKRGNLPGPHTFYFKIPQNKKLLGYWDIIADRMFKLRHCQNIEGVVRKLPLFDAPIDPGLLVKARAAGVDISSVLNETQAQLPNFRFSVLYSEALDFCKTVCNYGADLLRAMEKNDASRLELLLSTRRVQLNREMEKILEKRVDEAGYKVESLNKKLELAHSRAKYAGDKNPMTPGDATAISLHETAAVLKATVGGLKAAAAGVHDVPESSAGVGGWASTPIVIESFGGEHVGHSIESAAESIEGLAEGIEINAELAAKASELVERAEDYKQEEREADLKAEKVNSEIEAAKLRVAIASNELNNLFTQSDRLQRELDFLTSKFTNQDLYDWMVSRVSETYFQSYRLAYRLCKRAERCFQYELGLIDDTQGKSFIQFGHWDSLKNGLLAGEALSLDLRRMHVSYLERNARKFEITTHFSLKNLKERDSFSDPVSMTNMKNSQNTPSSPNESAFHALQSGGTCFFLLPEPLFDACYLGHYQRRLQRVSVTVVCPDTNLHTKNIPGVLTLKWNTVRFSAKNGSGESYARTPDDSTRFIDNYGAVPQQIALSSGQDDTGMFFTEMRDNLRDPRYLPFEGAGAISHWKLKLKQLSSDSMPNHISLSDIEDVILNVAYTALDGGPEFGPA